MLLNCELYFVAGRNKKEKNLTKTKVLNKRHNIDLQRQSQGEKNIKEKGLNNPVLNTNFQNRDTKKFFKNNKNCFDLISQAAKELNDRKALITFYKTGK